MPHVSIYDLQIEAQSAFGKWYGPQGTLSSSGRLPLPSEEEAAAMLATASQLLRAHGYEHYEVSNYALPGHQSRHNRKYWQLLPTIAFGPSAVSYLGHQRFIRPRKLDDYSQWIDSRALLALPAAEVFGDERRTADLQEVVMLALRTLPGLDLRILQEACNAKTIAKVEELVGHFVDRGLLVRSGENIRLADPTGFLFCNDIISSLFALLPGAALSATD